MRRAKVRGASATASASSSIAKSRRDIVARPFFGLGDLRVLARQIIDRHEGHLGAASVQQQIIGAGVGELRSGKLADDRRASNPSAPSPRRRSRSANRPRPSGRSPIRPSDSGARNRGASHQVVVARRPSSNPVSASRNVLAQAAASAAPASNDSSEHIALHAGRPGSSVSRRVVPLSQRRGQDRGR